MTLNPNQLAVIDRHLRKENWLLNESLIAELTDHYVNAITDAMAQGSQFELALSDVHKGFGGRKGLLQMEVDYGETQGRIRRRLISTLFKRYFRGKRSFLTISVFGAAYSLISNWPIVSPYVSHLSFTVLLVGLSVLYVISIRKLAQPQLSEVTEGIGWAMTACFAQGTILLNIVWMFARLLIPENWLVSGFPLLTATSVTLVFVWEAACFEAVTRNHHRRQTI